ncbi:MAG: hypothetical protein V4671_19405 [Armatimonadota bacterium]
MRKIFGGTLLLLLVMAAGLFYLYSNLEYYVKQQIETAGSEATGTAVNVDEVVIDLSSGTASIRGFRVANPEGFSSANMMSFSELNVVLDLNNLSRDRIGIMSILTTDPHILYEMKGDISNLDVMREKLAEQSSTSPGPASQGSDIYLDIARVDIGGIGATLVSPLLAAPVEVSLGDIALRDLHGTPEEIANQVMQPVLAQLSGTAARALLSTRAGDLRDDVLDRVDAGLEAAGENIREAGSNIREGLKDLLNGDDNSDDAPATGQ